jgi:hypothetical protein
MDGTVAGAVSTSDYESYGYDGNANRTSLGKRDGQNISYQYDALNRVSNDVYYGYDCVDCRPTRASVRIPGRASLTATRDNLAGSTADVTTTFTYNAANQMGTRTRDNTSYDFTAYAGGNFTYTPNGLNTEFRR